MGAQVPFTSINFGRDTSPEGRLVSKGCLEASIAGIGKFNSTPIFPISIVCLKKGVNMNPGDPNYDIKKLSIKSLSKRIYPEIVGAINSDIYRKLRERILKRCAINILFNKIIHLNKI